jgi:threonine synthase
VPPGADPFRCPGAATEDDDVDHVLAREIDPLALPPQRKDLRQGGFLESLSFPEASTQERNPFLRYRKLLWTHHAGRARGASDAELEDLTRRLDASVATIVGRGFVETPFFRSTALSESLGFGARGGVWIKDETDNVAGSHKARHLFGVLSYLRVKTASESKPAAAPRLAIASCGNAARAAAVLARAGGYLLDVYVPDTASEPTIEAIRSQGASITICPRTSGERGDPSVHRFREAVESGSLPFTCQGNENGLVLEGGETLGWEIVTALQREDVALDRIFVQVGGGALASSVITAFREARQLGAIEVLPRFHAIQTRGAFPLPRAYEDLRARILTTLGGSKSKESGSKRTDERAAAALRDHFASEVVQDQLRYAARHRSEFMWPWEEPPKSLAEGILDDETYDWFAIVRGMMESGGYPVVVSEEDLRRARELALSALPRPVSFTGVAGLAGLLVLRGEAAVKSHERVAVLFTGSA